MKFAELNHSKKAEIFQLLHSRPFPVIQAPCQIACLVLKLEEDRPRDIEVAQRHLRKFLDLRGISSSDIGPQYFSCDLDNAVLRWENHSEFLTYMILTKPTDPNPFQRDLFDDFPLNWLNETGGRVLTSIKVRIERKNETTEYANMDGEIFENWFVEESLALAKVLDDRAIAASDFQLDTDGHVRFLIKVQEDESPKRLGRLVQRLIEIEIYKSMALLTFPIAKQVFESAGRLEKDLNDIILSMAEKSRNDRETLEQLLFLSSKIELLSSGSSFRFSAARAYSELVDQRISMLKEKRIRGRQLFSDFMSRRFAPSIRTCFAAEARIDDISERATKATSLLGARVNVEMAEQNKNLLAQMDRRASLQMRLQETVEGLSVVAISYYAVSLLAYLLTPVSSLINLDKKILTAALVIPVVATVWFGTKRLKKRLLPNISENKPEV